METPPSPLPAPLIWTNEKYMVVLCPCCSQPEYRKHTTTPVISNCRGGLYEVKGLFDFKAALLGMKHRKNDCDAKRKYRAEAKAALALVRAKKLEDSKNDGQGTAPSSPSVVAS